MGIAREIFVKKPGRERLQQLEAVDMIVAPVNTLAEAAEFIAKLEGFVRHEVDKQKLEKAATLLAGAKR